MCWVRTIIWYNYYFIIIDYNQKKTGNKGLLSSFVSLLDYRLEVSLKLSCVNTEPLGRYCYHQNYMLPCLLVCLSWGIILRFFFKSIATLTVCKRSEAAAAILATNEADILRVIHD